MTAVSALIDTSNRRLYQITDSAVSSLPSSGGSTELNLVLQTPSALTETDIEFSSAAVGGGFSVDALASASPVGQFPVQVIANGPVPGHPDQWGIQVVLFYDDMTTFGAGSADSFRLNGTAFFLVSPVYAKF